MKKIFKRISVALLIFLGFSRSIPFAETKLDLKKEKQNPDIIETIYSVDNRNTFPVSISTTATTSINIFQNNNQ